SGQLLDRLLWEELGMARDRVYIANVVKCRPPGNRDPLPEEVATCRPYLERQIELIRPRVIVTLGNFAARLLLETGAGISSLRGRAYLYGDAMVVPTYHPSFVLRSGAAGEAMAGIRADLVRAKEQLGVAV
ncbi:MAG: uracil-DNA glycosylase, partial [Acidimicrobiales bacterium]